MKPLTCFMFDGSLEEEKSVARMDCRKGRELQSEHDDCYHAAVIRKNAYSC